MQVGCELTQTIKLCREDLGVALRAGCGVLEPLEPEQSLYVALPLIGASARIECRDVFLLREDRPLEDLPRQVEFLRDARVRIGCLLGLQLAVDPKSGVAPDKALDPVTA